MNMEEKRSILIDWINGLDDYAIDELTKEYFPEHDDKTIALDKVLEFLHREEIGGVLGLDKDGAKQVLHTLKSVIP
jgi:hypothetical protein